MERTCSHLAVMSHGRIVAAGPVADVAGGADQLLLEVNDPASAVEALRGLGVESVDTDDEGAVRVLPGTVPTAAVLAALAQAGVDVAGLRRERRLEDAFLELIGDAEATR